MNPRDKMIVALDVHNTLDAIQLVQKLQSHVGAFKVGLELYNAVGPTIFTQLREFGADRIFYDCKLHDIPNTVGGAMRAIALHGLWMVNVHASGGRRMVNSAATALSTVSTEVGLPCPILLGVTLLTSISEEELHTEMNVRLSSTEYVVHMAKQVQDAGGAGVVASPHEIESVRLACGAGFIIVTPGVRPAGVDAGDQRRVMTPGEAIRKGADYLVIGRAITGANDCTEAAILIAEEIGEAMEHSFQCSKSP